MWKCIQRFQTEHRVCEIGTNDCSTSPFFPRGIDTDHPISPQVSAINTSLTLFQLCLSSFLPRFRMYMIWPYMCARVTRVLSSVGGPESGPVARQTGAAGIECPQISSCLSLSWHLQDAWQTQGKGGRRSTLYSDSLRCFTWTAFVPLFSANTKSY